MVEVTQADRELLIELISFDSETIDAILAGNAFTWEVEQIARHRIAAMEEAWRDGFDNARSVVPEYVAHDLTEDVENDLWCDSATAIRALEGPTDDPA